MSRNLNEFFQDKKPVLEYTIKNKETGEDMDVVGDISTLNMLKAGNLYKNPEMLQDEAKMSITMFTIIFGEKNADYLINNLSTEGFLAVTEDIVNAMNGGEPEKTPS